MLRGGASGTAAAHAVDRSFRGATRTPRRDTQHARSCCAPSLRFGPRRTARRSCASHRARQYRDLNAGFLILGYEQLLRDFDHVEQLDPEIVVLDEAQRILVCRDRGRAPRMDSQVVSQAFPTRPMYWTFGSSQRPPWQTSIVCTGRPRSQRS